jgi:hypothetical protein
MGPVALINEELRAGRLLAPISEPVLKTRGYFFCTGTEQQYRCHRRSPQLADWRRPRRRG